MRWGLTTDASQRFERGVDPSRPGAGHGARDRAAAGDRGRAGRSGLPCSAVPRAPAGTRASRPAAQRNWRACSVLGSTTARVTRKPGGAADAGRRRQRRAGACVPPAHRFDIAIEADLIEEVARIVGYQAIPEADAQVPQRFGNLPADASVRSGDLLETLALRGYQEAITYAFVDPQLQAQLFPDPRGSRSPTRSRATVGDARVAVAGPAQSRTGEPAPPAGSHPAVRAWRALPARCGSRGRCRPTRELDTLAGIACGQRLPEQWGCHGRCASRWISSMSRRTSRRCWPRPAPGRNSGSSRMRYRACIRAGRRVLARNGEPVGWLGELHPSLVKALGLYISPGAVRARYRGLAGRAAAPIGRFPASRRCVATSPWWCEKLSL